MKRTGYYDFFAYLYEIVLFVGRMAVVVVLQMFVIILVVLHKILDPTTLFFRWLVRLLGRFIDFLLRKIRDLAYCDNER